MNGAYEIETELVAAAPTDHAIDLRTHAIGLKHQGEGVWNSIAGTCDIRRSDKLDQAMCRFARAYADQTEADHAALVRAVARGVLPAERGV